MTPRSGSSEPRPANSSKAGLSAHDGAQSPTHSTHYDHQTWHGSQRGSTVSLQSRPDGPHQPNTSRRRSRPPGAPAGDDATAAAARKRMVDFEKSILASPAASNMSAVSLRTRPPSPARSHVSLAQSSTLSNAKLSAIQLDSELLPSAPPGSRSDNARVLTSPASAHAGFGESQVQPASHSQHRSLRSLPSKRRSTSQSRHELRYRDSSPARSKRVSSDRPSSRRSRTRRHSPSSTLATSVAKGESLPAPSVPGAASSPVDVVPVPPQSMTRTQYKRVKAFLKTPGGLNGILAVAQYGISVALNRMPAYEARTGHAQSMAGFDLAHLRNFIGDFRNFMALGDMLAIAKSAKAHYKSGRRNAATTTTTTTTGETPATPHDRLQRGVGYLQHVANFGYSLFEAPAILSGRNIFRMSRDDGRNDSHKYTLTRVSCWFWALAISAQFLEIGMESLADRRARRRFRRGVAAGTSATAHSHRRGRDGGREGDRRRGRERGRRRDGGRERGHGSGHGIRHGRDETDAVNDRLDEAMRLEHAARRSKRHRRIVTNAIWVPVAIGWSLRKNPLSSQLLNVLNMTGKASEVLSKWKDTR